MEKKFKISDNPTVVKSVYGIIIALLCITAIIIGIIAANNKKNTPGDDVLQNPPVDDGGENNGGSGDGTGDGSGDQGGSGNQGETKVTYISPVSGKVMKPHSTETPVYSNTLEEWRIHTGIDISTAEGANVYAAADGEVSKVYTRPLLGKTVEITHAGGVKSIYSNLSPDEIITVGTAVKSGELIGKIGDSAIMEIADEAHLHFEITVNDKSVNPLDYISDDAKKTSLGITEGEAA